MQIEWDIQLFLVPEKSLRPILLVEDDPSTAKTVTMMLEEAGFKNITVTDTGEEAIDIAKIGGPKFYVVLLDLMLPGIDGFEVYRRLGEFFPAPLAVIFLTGLDDEESKEKAYRLVSGNIVEMEYITKPFHGTQLVNRLNLFIGSIHDRRERLAMLAEVKHAQDLDQIRKDLAEIRKTILKDAKNAKGEFLRSLGHDVLKGAIIGVFAMLSYFGLTKIPFDRMQDFFSLKILHFESATKLIG